MSERLLGRARRLAPMLVAAIVLAVLPQTASSSYAVTVYTAFCVNVILLVGLNLISGYGGQLSLGQAAFYGIGAYAVTIGEAKAGLQPAVTILLAPILGAAFATLVGLPSLRLRGLYFAMATLGITVVFQLVLNQANKLTGGPNGVAITMTTVGDWNLGQPRTLYVLAAALALAVFALAELFLRTDAGWGLRGAHASEPAAAVVGVNVYQVRLLSLAICGAFAGLAGALAAFNNLYVSPTTFSFFTSVMLFFVLAVGGLATPWGPLIGAGLLLVFDRWLTAYADKEPLVLAAIFLVALRLFPQGLGRVIDRGVDRLFATISRRPAAGAALDATEPA